MWNSIERDGKSKVRGSISKGKGFEYGLGSGSRGVLKEASPNSCSELGARDAGSFYGGHSFHESARNQS